MSSTNCCQSHSYCLQLLPKCLFSVFFYIAFAQYTFLTRSHSHSITKYIAFKINLIRSFCSKKKNKKTSVSDIGNEFHMVRLIIDNLIRRCREYDLTMMNNINYVYGSFGKNILAIVLLPQACAGYGKISAWTTSVKLLI